MKNNQGTGCIRRGMLAVTAGAALCPLVAMARPTLADLDQLAAQEAIRLAASRKLRLRLLIPEGSQGNVKPVMSAFTSATGIDLDLVVTLVDDINTKLMLDQMSDNGGYNLALPATFGIPELAEAGVLFDIGDFAARYEPSALRDSSLYTIGDSYDGRRYGFQADGAAYLMFYNKPWLDDADNQKRYQDRFGQPLAIPETWQDLDRQMAFIHVPDQNRFGGALFRTPT